MAEVADKKGVWSTLPVIVSTVAAIITGLGVLIPLGLHAAGKHPTRVATVPGASASPTASGSPGAALLPGAAMLAAAPSGVSFGSVVVGRSTQDVTVTIANNGSADATIDSAGITGTDQGAFAITASTCGNGSTVSAQGSCQVTLRFTPAALGSASGSLEIHYPPPDSSFMSVSLSGNGALL